MITYAITRFYVGGAPGCQGVQHALLALISLLAPFLTSAGEAAATTYYVSPNGNDTQSGTSQEKAWKSIQRANTQQLKPGDKLLFESGKVFSGNLVVADCDAGGGAPILIGSFGGPAPATIRAGLGSAVLVRDSSGVEVQDLICEGSDKALNKGCGVAFVNTLPGNKRLKHVRVRRVEASGFGREIRSKKQSGLNEGFQPPQGAGIWIGGAASDRSKSGFEDIEITGCSCHGNAYYGILITGYWDDHPRDYANANARIADCKVFGNTGDPLYHENHSGSGILAEDCDGGMIEHCVAYENGALCDTAPGGPCGIWAAGSNKVTIQYCESYRNHTGTAPDGDGFDLDGGSTNCVMQYNFSHDNDGAGYLVYTYAGAPHPDLKNVVRFNISAHDDVKKHSYGGIYVGNDGHGMSDVLIYNNTIVGQEGAPAGIVIHGAEIGASFYNNLILSAARVPQVKIDRESNRIVFQGNLYWSADSKFKVVGKKAYETLEAWRESGREMLDGKAVGLFVSPEMNPISPDKQKNNVEEKTFELTPVKTSPAGVSGIDLGRLKIDPGTRDFQGVELRLEAGHPIGAWVPGH